MPGARTRPKSAPPHYTVTVVGYLKSGQMRFQIVAILLALSTTTVYGQGPCEPIKSSTIENGDTLVFAYVEKTPYPKHGLELYLAWLNANMDQKLKTKKNVDKKTVYISFIVHENGTTSDFRILRGVGNPYDNEALRLLMENPRTWAAGQCGDRKVKTRMVLPVKL
jgi:hypothetical protein